jgi:host factor-I protein
MSNQNLQDGFLNNARKERVPVTIYLTSGVKLSGRVKGFDKYCVVFETSHQEQLIFKHAISTVVTPKHHGHSAGHRAMETAAPQAPSTTNESKPALPVPEVPGTRS